MVKGKILFDRSHGQELGIYKTADFDSLGLLSLLLEKKGYECDELEEGPVTYEKLRRYDTFVFPPSPSHYWFHFPIDLDDVEAFVYDRDWNLKNIPEDERTIEELIYIQPSILENDITAEEVYDIKKFIMKDDKSLLLMYNFDSNFFNPDNNLRKLGNFFGFQPADRILWDVEMVFKPHQITNKVKKLQSYFSCIDVDPEKAEIIINTKGKLLEISSLSVYDTSKLEKLLRSYEEDWPFDKGDMRFERVRDWEKIIPNVEDRENGVLVISKEYKVASLSFTTFFTYGPLGPEMFFSDSYLNYLDYDNKQLAMNLFDWFLGIEKEIPKTRPSFIHP